MWTPLTTKFSDKPDGHKKFEVLKRIEFKYTLFIVGVFALSLVFFSIPVIYYINFNYDLFIELAYESTPAIVQQLEKEKFWINNLFIATVLASLLVLTVIVFRLLSRVDRTLQVVKNKIRNLSHGKWNSGPIIEKNYSEFTEIIGLYNHLYYFIREIQNQEVENLINLNIPIDHPQHQEWINLINRKRLQIGLDEVQITSNGATVSEAPNSRHAS